MPSAIDNLELLEARISKLEKIVGQFDKLDKTKVKKKYIYILYTLTKKPAVIQYKDLVLTFLKWSIL